MMGEGKGVASVIMFTHLKSYWKMWKKFKTVLILNFEDESVIIIY